MDKDLIQTARIMFVIAIFVVGGLVFVKMLPVLIALFVSLMLALTLTPLVDLAREKGVPRGVTTTFIFLLLIGIFASVGIAGLKPMINQVRDLAEVIPNYLENYVDVNNSFSTSFKESLTGQLTQSSGNFIKSTLGAYSGILYVIFIVFITFYLLIAFDEVRTLFINAFPHQERDKVKRVVLEVENKLGAFLRGQLILAFIMGVTTFIGLYLLGINYALSLALVAGVLEIIPVFGPILAAIPALIVASENGPWSVLAVLILYILLQQLEGNLLVPKVFEKTIGFNPLVTLLVIFIGTTLLGTIGFIISIPASLLIRIALLEVYEDYFKPARRNRLK